MIFDPQERTGNRAARVSMALFRMSQAIKKLTQTESDAQGLSPVQIQALLFAFNTRNDVASIGNFAKSIGATHVTAVKIVNGLVQKGLMTKKKMSGDRRVTLLDLTAKGREAALKLEDWGHTLEDALQSIPDSVLASFELGLGVIVSAMHQRGNLVISEPCPGCVHFRRTFGRTRLPIFAK
ncbi:MarR family winged helix-turn-helix transcriptional regulator [Gordoniibacillus kamchatkensis]|uniref:MarR family winged helix-turn-helix transcriptional regulator n=1 Tax=Gordoniibacillus kamchatkensis TaxID=1590651 RepID=UPI000AEB24FC|nr:MarR family transcriptional regulator [Paenibacillus sp. VKM B-2647]